MNKKEAIEIIKKNWPDSRYTMLQEALQTLIPDLKESEDERMKSCIGMCLTDATKQRFEDFNTTLKDCLAWFEKQGEQEPIEWSEEDEKMWLQIINEMEAIKSNSSTIFEKNIAQDKIDWLKSIKPNHWKPRRNKWKLLKTFWLVKCLRDIKRFLNHFITTSKIYGHEIQSTQNSHYPND